MDVKLINPFLNAVTGVMPQLGFASVERKGISMHNDTIVVDGVVMALGIVGDKKGNVVYNLSMEDAKKIASTMMMGMPIEELDDMAKSALSELSNMLTANSGINFSNDGINLDISVPTFLHGTDINVEMKKNQSICVEFDIDGIIMKVFVAME